MDFFRRFMAGRYGSDPLNNALLILGHCTYYRERAFSAGRG